MRRLTIRAPRLLRTLVDHLRNSLNRAKLEHIRSGDVDFKLLANQTRELTRRNGRAAAQEEIILDGYHARIRTEHFAPQMREKLLIGVRWSVCQILAHHFVNFGNFDGALRISWD